MNKKILIFFLIFVLISFVLINLSFATDIDTTQQNTNFEESISSIDNTIPTSDSTYNPVSSVTNYEDSSDLSITNIINIILIVVGVVLILLGIAIIIKLK